MTNYHHASALRMLATTTTKDVLDRAIRISVELRMFPLQRFSAKHQLLTLLYISLKDQLLNSMTAIINSDHNNQLSATPSLSSSCSI
jgi:hypothetical protein